MLENGTMIIDTPGMRVMGMCALEGGLDTTSSDIEELAIQCKFRDCNHKSELGCRVKEALETGELSNERWNNYIKLKKEVKFVKNKEKLITISRNEKNKRKY